MLTTMILVCSALAALALGWSLCRSAAPVPPPPPQPADGRSDLPLCRQMWLELADDDADYDHAAFDRRIDHMLRTTAQWQRCQPPQEVA